MPIDKMKVLISSRSFGKNNRDVVNVLKNAGLEPLFNPLDRKPSEEELITMLDGVVGIIAGTENITKNVLSHATSLKVISRYGMGLDNVDLDTARQRGILVYSTPETPAISVAELTLSLMLNLLRKICKVSRSVQNNSWKPEMGNLLTEKTIGIIGLGRIGKKVVQLLRPFEGNILTYETKPDNKFIKKYKIQLTSFDTLVHTSDIISLHCPLNEKTHFLIGKDELSQMKTNAILINTARGGLIDENALYNALKTDKIAGAAIDVFENEPYTGKLREFDNVILTPHIGSYTVETRTNMEIEAATNLINGLKEMKIL
jgi:D-3-phosphoglycerate dehydrogenase